MRRILKLENNGAFRIAPSLKILSKNNYSSPQNCEPYFYISSHFTNHYAIPNFIKPSINPFQLSPPPPSTNSFLTRFERSHGRNPFLIEKKKKNHSIHPIYPYLPLNANFQSQTISNFLLKSIRKPINCFLEVKKAGGGEKLLPTIPNPLKPSSDLLDLLARPPSTSTGSVGIGPWTQTFVDRGDPLQGIGGEDPEMDEEEEGSGWQWVASRTGTFAWKSWQIGCRATTGSTIASQQQQRRRRRLFLFLNRLDRFFSLPRLTGCLDGLCVFACLASGCVLTRTRRERAEYMGQPTASGHRNATLTHHTHSRHDRAHHRLSRYLGDGCGKERGWRRGLGFCSVSARPTTSFRGCLRSEVVRVWIFNRLEFWEKILGEKKKPAPRGRGHSILTFLSYYPTGPRRSKPLSNFFPNAPPCPIQWERSVFRPQTLSTRNKATRSLDIVEHRHRYANNFDRENR